MCKTVWQSCNWKTTFADKIACNTHANVNTQYRWMLLSFPGKSFPFLVKTFRYISSMCVGFLLCFLATSRDFSTCDKCQHLFGLLADKAGPGQALSSMVTFYRRRRLFILVRPAIKENNKRSPLHFGRTEIPLLFIHSFCAVDQRQCKRPGKTVLAGSWEYSNTLAVTDWRCFSQELVY